MNNEYNKILDQLMEKISLAVANEEYDKSKVIVPLL